ncbi:MAG: PHP domain-containing protein [Campylobacter sp.]|nr:PHP domain-containing protein [Campylobacter sp.]
MKNLKQNFDLHIHTIYSDGRSTPQDVVEMAKRKKIGFAVTDHNHIKGAILATKIAEKDGIASLCGIELGTNEGKEMLIYFDKPYKAQEFYIREVEPYRTSRMTRINRSMWSFVGENFSYLKDRYEFYFTTIPHPFGVLYKSVKWDIMLSKALVDSVDSIEAINFGMSDKANAKALAMGKDLGKRLTASSDAHLKSGVGAVSTCLEFDAEGRICSTDISHNLNYANMLKSTLALLQITKENINYSLLKRGSFKL